jgi:regulator of cell morphogenesis and NO signaling
VLEGKFQLIGQDQEKSMKKSKTKSEIQDKDDKTIRPEQTVAETVLRHPRLRERLEQLGIDYCCGGKRLLADAVKKAGLDLKTVLTDLEQGLHQGHPAAAVTNWTTVPLTVLADHILDTHHLFTKTQLERVDTLLTKVQNAHRSQHGSMLDSLRGAFEPLQEELEAHLNKEEQILFPAIKGIDGFVCGTGARPVVHCGSIAHPIHQMEHEHDGAGALLVKMRGITHDYRLPDDACQTFTALYEALQALESDLHEHIHLENNILFPASIEQEQRMNADTES